MLTFHFIFHMYPLLRYRKLSKCTHFGKRRTATRFGNTHIYSITVTEFCKIRQQINRGVSRKFRSLFPEIWWGLTSKKIISLLEKELEKVIANRNELLNQVDRLSFYDTMMKHKEVSEKEEIDAAVKQFIND